MTAMREVKPIAIVRGAEGWDIQQLFHRLVERWRATHRVAGVIEERNDADMRTRLRVIGDDRRYALFQDLGPGSTSCALDAEGAVLAGEAARAAIMRGCDVAVISKFGKLEAEARSGLLPAFAAAFEAEIPILTSVSPRFGDAWERFAQPHFVMLAADEPAIEAWWHAIRTARSGA